MGTKSIFEQIDEQRLYVLDRLAQARYQIDLARGRTDLFDEQLNRLSDDIEKLRNSIKQTRGSTL